MKAFHRILLLIACWLLSIHILAQPLRQGLSGKVKSIEQTLAYAYLQNGEYKKVEFEGWPTSKRYKLYNKKGELIETRWALNDVVGTVVKFKYNSKGMVNLQEHFDQNGNLKSTVRRTSDSTTVRETIRGTGTVNTTEKWLSPNCFKFIETNEQQKLLTITTQFGNEKGWTDSTHVLSVLRGDTAINSWEYRRYNQIDKEGNWTECLISESKLFDSVQVKTRVIEYY